ncbi:MAG: HugZ family protein [Paracoccaceae bacterium]
MPRPDPYLACDDTARQLAASLITAARHAALAVTDPETRTPNISRIALARATDGTILTLISQLSAHTAALQANPACAFMVGEPGTQGDPLTHPRLMIQAHASFILRSHPDHTTLRGEWLEAHPKTKLYIDFADFGFVRLTPHSAVLNAGFGKAYRLQPADFHP